ncbi:MAG: hypothetical protein ACRELY_23875 [Polyangiaceae bacterium]
MEESENDRTRPAFVDLERQQALSEESSEDFDRVAFTMETLDRMPPRMASIAVYPSSPGKSVRIYEGRAWAIVSVPPMASRRAIVHAVATIARHPIPAWSMAIPYR